MIAEASAIAKWLETQSPLWVIYAIVIIGLIQVGRMLLQWVPVIFQKHCEMLDTATASMAESATVISGINVHVNSNGERLKNSQEAIADAAVPACKAIMVVTPPDKQAEVRQHLDEVVRILTKPTLGRGPQ